MRLEATKFRPREVVKHVLQTAAASLKKALTLEGNIADDVPIEVNFTNFVQTRESLCFEVFLLISNDYRLLEMF